MSGPDTDQWRLAAEMFERLVELPRDQRAQWLNENAGSNADLLVAVQRLLDAHDSHPASDTGSGQLAVDAALRQWASQGDELAPGAQVGPFQILRVLGQGGMGQVYLAERRIDGQVQQVALKLPRERLSDAALARFRRERAILAHLEHPAIARLIDVGELGDGRPYLVMEYVEGQSILDYCATRRLNLRARLQLVVQVLQALQYAHERLVLHRDIKSANVLVDSHGQPRVLDFGIAKMPEADGKSSTTDGPRFFSLACAAPEQVLGAPTSAATDVYAVGVLLYELLTGVPPLPLDGVSARASLEMAVDRVPPLASVACAALPAERAAELAQQRGLRPGAWVQALRGDLDVILACALRKEPRARYPTATAFAADLTAALQLRPITARSNERWYRMGRFVRRHAIAVALTSALLLSIIGFVTLTMLQSTQLRLARDNAELRRAQAEQVTLFLKDLFRQSDPAVARGQDLSARDLLDRGTEELRSSMDGQPLMKAELLGVLADIRLSLNDYPAAESLAKQAIELRASNAGDVAASHEQMARIRLALADFKGVLSHVDAAVKPGLPLAQASDRELRLLIMRVSARTGLGAPPAEACEALEALTAEAVRRYGPEHSRTLDLRLRLSLSLGAAGQQEREQQIIDEVTRDLPLAAATNDPELAELALRRAAMARHRGKLDEARRLASWALDVRRVVFGASHSKTAAAMSGLAAAVAESGQLDAAQALFEEALAINTKLYAPEHAVLVGMRYNLGVFYLRSRKDPAAAIPLLETVVADARKSSQTGPNLGRFQMTLARAYSEVGRVDAARSAYIAALALAAANTSPDSMVPIIEAEIQCLDPQAVRSATAQAQLDAVIERLRADDGPDDPVLLRLQHCREAGTGDSPVPAR